MRRAEPALPEVGVIALVPNRWTDPWMPRHQVLSRLAQHFQVAWLDPAPHWRDALADPRRFRLRNGQPLPGLTVVGHVAPDLYRPDWLRRLALRSRLLRARRMLRRRGATTIVLYLWRPEFEPALALVAHEASCYHIDDEYTFSTEDRPTPAQEARLLAAVDQVFIHSEELVRKKGATNPNTVHIPNGVDYDAFAATSAEPPDLAPIPHPRIGYTGWLKRQLDWVLLRSIAERHPAWSLVFVGPRKPHAEIADPIRALERLPNVHFLGRKSVDELTAYPRHFDVCIMPYRIDGYTRYIYPLKLHEYLASGRPVVGSPVPALRAFSEVVTVAGDASGWSVALQAALMPAANDVAARDARQQIARAHDWDPLVRRIAAAIAQRVGGRAAALFSTTGELEPMIDPIPDLVTPGGFR